jgi:hypothetical protein
MEIYAWGYSKARSKLNRSIGWTAIGSISSLFGSNLAKTAPGKFTIQASSAYLDAATIWLLGKKYPIDENSSQGAQNIQANNSTSDDIDMFVTTVDNNGEFTAPEGGWDIAAFKNGYARIGNPQGEPFRIYDGETNEIIINPIAVDEVTENDLVCSTSDDDGSMSGSFSATCFNGTTFGSSFSVTISNNGPVSSVSGIYDYGNITGGVADGFMSVTLDGAWSDCVLGGYLNNSDTNLSGSGTVSCSEGSCYGTWEAD